MENQNPNQLQGDSNLVTPNPGVVGDGLTSTTVQQIPVTEQNSVTPTPAAQPLEVNQNTLETPATAVVSGASISPLQQGDSLEQPATNTAATTERITEADAPSVDRPAVEAQQREVKRHHRRASKALTVISAGALAVVLLIAGLSAYITRRNAANLQSPSDAIAEQDINIGEQTEDKLGVLGLNGGYRKLVVNGDLVTRGSLFVGSADGNFFGQLDASGLTANQTYVLPNASGEICLDTGNCNEETSVPIETAVNTATGDVTGNVVRSINGQFGDVDITIGSGEDAQTISLLQGTGITLETVVNGDDIEIQISTTAFLQGGNTYGTTAVLGTNDNNDLRIRTNGSTRATFTADGELDIVSNTTITSDLLVQNSSSEPILDVDVSSGTIGTESLIPLTPGALTTDVFNTNINTSQRGGQYDTILMDNSGLPRIIHFSSGPSDLAFIQCNNTSCTSFTERTIQTSGNVGSHASAALDGSNNIHIVYRDGTNSQWKFIRCNSDCTTTSTPVTLTSWAGFLESRAASIKVGSDGFARIVVATTNNTIEFFRCSNSDCSSSTQTTLVSSSNVESPSIALASDNTARVIYRVPGTGLVYKQCTNANCSTSNTTTLASPGGNGAWGSIVLDSANLAHISYQTNNNKLGYINCLNSSCSSRSSTTLDTGINVISTSIGITSDDLPQIAYYDSTNNDAKHITCEDQNCSSIITVTADSSGNVGRFISLAMGTDNYARLAYYDATALRPAFAHLGQTTDSVSGASIGTSSNPYGELHVTTINTERFVLQSDTNSTTAFQVKNSTGTSILTVDTTNKWVGVGPVSPSATLTVGATQPADRGSNGKDADTVLSVTGAKGGNTVGTTGQTAGDGSSVVITAGDGGDAEAGSTNGNGGNITLQAGAAGSGTGNAGTAGSVIVQTLGDSTAGFVVQNANGDLIFSVDTLNGTAYIGADEICTMAGNCTGVGGMGDVLQMATASAQP